MNSRQPESNPLPDNARPWEEADTPTVPDFLIWRCVGCGTAAVGVQKPCDCATNVGARTGPNGKEEQTWWVRPPVDYVAVPRELLERIVRAKGGFNEIMELEALLDAGKLPR